MAELRSEIRLQNGLLRPLEPPEYEALRSDIEAHGVRVPILLGKTRLIDGRHRYQACEELGLDCPFELAEDLTAEEELELAFSLNAARRQLLLRERRQMARVELMRDPARSDSLIGRLCGLSHPTVATIRKDLREQLHAEKEALVADRRAKESEGEHVDVAPPVEEEPYYEERVDQRGAHRQVLVNPPGTPGGPVQAAEANAERGLAFKALRRALLAALEHADVPEIVEFIDGVLRERAS